MLHLSNRTAGVHTPKLQFPSSKSSEGSANGTSRTLHPHKTNDRRLQGMIRPQLPFRFITQPSWRTRNQTLSVVLGNNFTSAPHIYLQVPFSQWLIPKLRNMWRCLGWWHMVHNGHTKHVLTWHRNCWLCIIYVLWHVRQQYKIASWERAQCLWVTQQTANNQLRYLDFG